MANPNMMVSSSVASSTAPLKSVSFSALANRDVQAASDLVEGCVKEGFVYLDMSGWGEQKPVTSTWAELHSFAKLLFDVPETVKKDFDFHKVSDQKNFGFKESGTETGVVEGNKDGFEMFMVRKQQAHILTSNYGNLINQLPEPELHNGGTLAEAVPDAVKQAAPLLSSYANTCRTICDVVLDRLSDQLGISGSLKLNHSHKDLTQSPSLLSFLKYRAYQPETLDVGQNAHTDPGSLTLLISSAPGLQVFNSRENQWQFIEPRPNHYIMNVGDCLRFLSEGKLSSSLHRVVPHPSTRGLERYSIGYFLSPDNHVTFQRGGEGRVWSSKEWHDTKFVTFTAPVTTTEDMQSTNSILTGRHHHLPHWDPWTYVAAKE